MTKKILFLLWVCLNTTLASAQYINPALRPAPTSDMPEWAKLLYQEPLNAQQIDVAFRNFYQNHDFVKNSYTRYYKRWRRSIERHLTPSGEVAAPNYDALLDFQAHTPAANAGVRSANSWTFVGPKETFWLKDDNAAQSACPWQTNIYAFAIAPSDPNTIYVGAETSGFYKTTDKGMTWTNIGANFLIGSPSEAVAIHPNNPNIVYFGSGSQIIKTTDGGNTFSVIYSQSNLFPNRIIINPNNPNIILAACSGGLRRSINGGTSWTAINSGAACYDVEFNAADPNRVYLLKKKTGTNDFSEFYTSSDGGVNFTLVTSGWPTSVADGAGRLAVTAANPNYLYAVLLTTSNPTVVKSTDGGANWASIATGGTAALDMTNGQGYYDLDVEISPLNANHVIVATNSSYKSTDGGLSYTPLGGYDGPFEIHPDIQEIHCMGADTWISTDGGMNYSTDFFTSTANHSARNNGISGADFWGFGQGWNEDIMVGGRYHNGNSAMSEYYPAGYALRMGGAEAGTGYVIHGKARAVKYSDLGDGWILPATFNSNSDGRFTFSKTPNEDYYGFNAGEVETATGCYGHLFLTEGNSIWKTTNGGISFTSLFTFPAKAKKIELSRNNPNVIYVNTDNSLYKSTNGGANFTLLTIPSGFSCNQMSMSINPFNENELWISSPNGTAGSRIFKTINGGTSWTNLNAGINNLYEIFNIVHIAGTSGGVYAIALPKASNGLPAKVFYRNNSLAWTDVSDGLPATFSALKAVPFYKGGVLRMAGNQGIWETPLYENPSTSSAYPSVDKLTTGCVKDTFYFEDFSYGAGASSYSWSFSPTPIFVSNSNVRNPKVVFGAAGAFNATLSVNGGLSKTILVTLGNGCLAADTIPGNALSLNGTSAFAAASSNLNLNSNTVTMTAWIKSSALQSSFAGIFFARGGATTAGLSLTATNELRYHWNDNGYGFASNLIVPNNQWTHVALVASPTKMALYMNGKAAVNTTTILPEEFNTPLNIGLDPNGTTRYFNGLIDEVCVFDRSLTQNEIRELMHLTKVSNFSGLVSYYQFNENTGTAYDNAKTKHLELTGGAVRSTSSAPVGKGVSNRQTVTAGGVVNFTGTGATLKFPTSGTRPNGELCLSRINQNPDQTPSGNPAQANAYWIVNNYGTNTNFSALDSIAFSNAGNTNSYNANQFDIFKRGSFADGSSWGVRQAQSTGVVQGNDGSIGFGVGNNITNFGQFVLQPNSAPLAVDWLSFTAAVQQQQVQLRWEVVEMNTDRYELERSENGVDFQVIATIGSRKNNGLENYNYADKQPLRGISYYRVTEIGKDGARKNSAIRAITFSALPEQFVLFPNPVDAKNPLHINTDFKGKYTLKIYNSESKKLSENTFSGDAVLENLALPAGIYFYEIFTDTQRITGKFIAN